MEYMDVYCAFLRGVNINGRSMKMTEVREVFLKAGMQNVVSVLATGNIIFSSADSKKELRQNLEKAMKANFDSDVNMIIKNVDEVRAMASGAPFSASPDLHCYVFVAEDGFAETLANDFRKITPIKNELGELSSGIFYWQVPKGSTLDAGFSKILSRTDIKDKATSRNINTIHKILGKMSK